MKCRRGVVYEVPKSIHWREDVLSSMDENRFRQMLRVSREQFAHLLSLICSDKVFTKCTGKQFPIDLQLAIVLFRLGSSGESASIAKIATFFGIGDGGTLVKITKRIFSAFLKLIQQYIFWPDSTERSEIVRETFSELPFCIGYVDGTEIKLAEAPVKNHVDYFSRCHIYALKAQIVCDYELKIRHVVTGYSGSTHDSKMLKNCSLYKEPSQFFSGQEWIAGDSAYPLSNTIITPYRSNAQHLDAIKRKQFNLQHSKFRVRVEHCFGILKGRFNSLKELRMRIHNEESQTFCNDWVLVCCILHNILIDSTDIEQFEEVSQNQSAVEEQLEESSRTSFEMKRQMLYHLMFPGTV